MTPVRQKIVHSLYSVTRPSMLERLNELNQLQWLSVDEQIAFQQKRLLGVLEYANTYVPYYRDLFKEIGFHPLDFVTTPDCFQDLPFLTKDIVRQNFDRLIMTQPEKQGELRKAKTGGTTGEPMWFMQDRNYQEYNAACNFHIMQWSGWDLGQPQGMLWGHVLAGSGSESKSIAVRLREWMVGRFWSNAFHMTPESMRQFATQLERHPGTLVWSYVSTMYRFAQFVQNWGGPIKLHAIYTAAEPLYDHHRELIETVFDCRVFDCYSCVEIGHIACECECHHGLHLMMRNCYLEVLLDGKPVSDGQEGEFILTNLTNFGFPFIRYKIEDGGRKHSKMCSCGRGLPMLEIVEGRIIDFFKTRDKGKIWGAFVVPMVPYLGKIRQYQIVQESLDTIVFRIIRDGPIDESKFAEIQKACKINLGENVKARLEYVDRLPSTPTGKHRYVISKVK